MSTEEPGTDLELQALLRRLDHEPPRVRADDVIARATARRPRPLQWAAGVLLALAGAAAAYAAPGSPLPRWIDEITGSTAATSPPPAPATSTPASPPQVSGIDVTEPVASVVIRPTRGGFLRVTFVEDALLVARAPGGAARFISDPDRVTIELLRPDTVELLVPRAASPLDIAAGGRLLLHKQGERVTATVNPDAAGTYLFPINQQ